MSFLDLVQSRHSVRDYAATPVSRDIIDRCLEAARLSPSACNSQPWKFIVIDDIAKKNEVARAAFSGIYSMNKFAAVAPVLIVVITERSRFAARLGAQLRNVQYSLIDLGIACEHLILQAAEERVGTCWLGWFNDRAVKRCLGLSRKDRVDCVISMGYPKTNSVKDKTRRSLDEIRSYFSDK